MRQVYFEIQSEIVLIWSILKKRQKRGKMNKIKGLRGKVKSGGKKGASPSTKGQFSNSDNT